MRRNKGLLRAMILVGVVGVVLIAAKKLPAGFYAGSLHTQVEIEGVNYGSFDQITGLESLNSKATKNADDVVMDSTQPYTRVTLRRDFVTDPSLYIWAKKLMIKRSGLKDVHLVTLNEDGEEVSRRVLKFCQPLSWTVEAANPALGGFHETIDLAVQEIAAY